MKSFAVKRSSKAYIADYRMFVLIAVLFLIGSIIGLMAVFHMDSNLIGNSFNDRYFSRESISILSALKIPICAAILGTTCFGVFLIPIISALKGFSLTFVSAGVFLICGFSDVIFYIYIFLFNFFVLLFLCTSMRSSLCVFNDLVFSRSLSLVQIKQYIKYVFVYLILLFFIHSIFMFIVR